MELTYIQNHTPLLQDFLTMNLPRLYQLVDSGVPTFLVGSSVKGIMLNSDFGDIDIVILSPTAEPIREFIIRNGLEYDRNSFGGYRVFYNNIKLDMWHLDDLYYAIEFNLDGLFYHLNSNTVIPVGFVKGVKDDTLEQVCKDVKHPNIHKSIARRRQLLKYFKDSWR